MVRSKKPARFFYQCCNNTVWYKTISLSTIKQYSLLFIITFFLLVITGSCRRSSLADNPPVVKQGILDLRNWDFENNGSVKLNGEWEFYWDEFVYADDFHKAPPPEKNKFVQLPESWNDYQINGKKLGGDGYASYRINVQIQNPNLNYALRTGSIHTAYRLYVNGKLVHVTGQPDKNRQRSIPRIQPGISLISLNSDKIEIILQVSNFHTRTGGAKSYIEFGLAEYLFHNKIKNVAGNLFLIGCILSMGLYHFYLFLLRKKELALLYFGNFCILVSIFLLMTGEHFFQHIFPFVSWNICARIQNVCFILALPMFISFVNDHFPLEHSKTVTKITQYISYLFTAFIIITPIKIQSYAIFVYQVLILLVSLYSVYTIILASTHKREGAKTFLLGCFILLLTVTNDILYDHEISRLGNIFGYGLLFFIFLQSFRLSMRFIKAFKNSEYLSERLEQRVLERTEELDLLTREFEHLATIDPLTEVNNRRKFFVDLENEISRSQRYNRPLSLLMLDIDHFKKINDTFGHKAGDKALQLFCNICNGIIRECDILGRLGGEEFAIALPETSIQNALSIAERIRLKLSKSTFNLNEDSISFTVSIGVALQQQDEIKPEILIENADKALYQAKQNGRNQVVSI